MNSSFVSRMQIVSLIALSLSLPYLATTLTMAAPRNPAGSPIDRCRAKIEELSTSLEVRKSFSPEEWKTFNALFGQVKMNLVLKYEFATDRPRSDQWAIILTSLLRSGCKMVSQQSGEGIHEDHVVVQGTKDALLTALEATKFNLRAAGFLGGRPTPDLPNLEKAPREVTASAAPQPQSREVMDNRDDAKRLVRQDLERLKPNERVSLYIVYDISPDAVVPGAPFPGTYDQRRTLTRSQLRELYGVSISNLKGQRGDKRKNLATYRVTGTRSQLNAVLDDPTIRKVRMFMDSDRD